ncbi:MAG TPA: hypothetical protein VKI65_16780, partial [Gemmataceae bacterium]|nr:hypothetical protein [Gemmataceae bacterium]
EQRQQIVKVAAACLEQEGPRVRGAAIGLLRDLGRSASTTLAALEAIQRHDPSDRLRDLAKRAIDQIRSNTPAPVELARLREELDRLKKANDELKERLEKIETLERKNTKAAALSGQ